MSKRKPYQEVYDAAGRLCGYRKQVADPLTKRRKYVHGKTPLEVMARASKVAELRRDYRAGLVTHEEAAQRAARAADDGSSLLFDAAWAEYLHTLGTSAWRSKVEGFGALHVLPFFTGRALPALTFEVMQEWLARAERAVSRRTCANYFGSIRKTVALQIEAGRLTRFPWGAFRVKVPRNAGNVGATRAAMMSGADFARFLVAAHDEDQRSVARGAQLADLTQRLGLMVCLSLRRGEAIALAWDCIRQLPDGNVQVDIRYQAREGWRGRGRERPTDDPKWGSSRVVVVTKGSEAHRLLVRQRLLLEAAGLYSPTGPVFPDVGRGVGGRLGDFRGRNVVRPEVMRRLAQRSGVDSPGRWVQHSTRHSTVTLSLATGADIGDVMRVTGHKRAETLRHYMAMSARSNIRLPELLPAGLMPSLPEVQAAAVAAPELPFLAGSGAVAPMLPDLSTLPEVAGTGEAAGSPEALAVDESEARARAREYHERYHGHRVADLDVAFREWVALGCPMTPAKDSNGRLPSRDHLPATVRAAGEAAAKRAREKARRDGADEKALALAAMRGRRAVEMAWHRTRAATVAAQLARGATFPFPALLEAWAVGGARLNREQTATLERELVGRGHTLASARALGKAALALAADGGGGEPRREQGKRARA